MTGIVRKWGKGLAIRVPIAIAKKLDLRQGDKVDFETSAKTLLIRHKRRSKYRLSDLLAGYKDPYPHRDLNRDPPVGREIQ